MLVGTFMCLKVLSCAVYAKQHAAPSSDVDIPPFRGDLDLAYRFGVSGMRDLQSLNPYAPHASEEKTHKACS